MGFQKRGERRKCVNKERYANDGAKKLTIVNDVDADKVSICLDSSSTEEVNQDSNVMEEESTAPRKLSSEILIIDEGGCISLSSDIVDIPGDQSKEKRRRYVSKECYNKNGMKKLKITKDIGADKVSICLDSPGTEEVNQVGSNVIEKEATLTNELNSEILIIDEEDNVSISSGNNMAEFENTVEPPIVAEDVMFVDEAGVTYGSSTKYSEKVYLEMAKKNAADVEQAEYIFYVDEVGSIHLSTNTKSAKSVSLLPFENSETEKIHEKSGDDLETEMKIKRLKEEIYDLEEKIKYIESLDRVDSNM